MTIRRVCAATMALLLATALQATSQTPTPTISPTVTPSPTATIDPAPVANATMPSVSAGAPLTVDGAVAHPQMPFQFRCGHIGLG